ncbi:hypothetical protein SVAN01_07781 [Stagonosporopsis vannaccii]|nr:hypothetical protein SVAN01_07781 [Stagonosporopsis vannaccii]
MAAHRGRHGPRWSDLCAMLAATCRSQPRYQMAAPPPETSVRKACLMSLTVMHETVLHVAQMHPPTRETDGILSGSPRRAPAPPSPVPLAAQGTL